MWSAALEISTENGSPNLQDKRRVRDKIRHEQIRYRSQKVKILAEHRDQLLQQIEVLVGLRGEARRIPEGCEPEVNAV
jgi:hypothetical protein